MTDIVNNRKIVIDNDTIVGYDYPNKKFYITNKGTTTTRNTAQQTVAVLVKLGITSIEINEEEIGITPDYLKETIQDSTEELSGIQYTLEDSGSYIKTLQFNDWVDYPLTIDCEKGNLFIKNTNIIFPLGTNEAPDSRVLRLCQFYKETLGLYIPNGLVGVTGELNNDTKMLNCYNLLVNQYDIPGFYNVLTKNDETSIITYTGSFKLNNFNSNSIIDCESTRNPNNETSSKNVGSIISIDNTENTITLKEPIESSTFLAPNFKVVIEGASYEEEGTTYSADGTYAISQTITESDGTKITAIQLTESPAANYTYQYPELYLQSSPTDIYSIEKENNVIRTSPFNFPVGLTEGDKIHIENTTEDGHYTVKSVSSQIIQISDTVLSINNDKITINTATSNLQIGSTIQIQGTNTADDNQIYIVTDKLEKQSGTTILTVNDNVPFSYGVSISNPVNVVFTTNPTTNSLTILDSLNIVLNPQDLIQVTGTDTNDKIFTILQVTRDNAGYLTLKLDSEVSSYEGTASIKVTPMTPVTIVSSTVSYYNVYIEETIPKNYISTSVSPGKLYKDTLVSSINNIEGTKLTTASVTNLKKDDVVFIYSNGNFEKGTVNDDAEDLEVILTDQPQTIMPAYPTLYSLEPVEDVMLNITKIKDYAANEIPTGKFLLDNFSICQGYLESIGELDKDITGIDTSLPELSDEIKEKMYTILQEGTIIDKENVTATFKGLYSEVYSS